LNNFHRIQLLGPSDADECDATALAISTWIAKDVEAIEFKQFYQVAGPIAGVTFVGSYWYAYSKLGGDVALFATFCFALFVTFRVFDLMSDWGMYAISLSTEHKGLPLRHASLAFSIIGSILLIIDLKTMVSRAEHWFGKTDKSDSLKKVGQGMLTIVCIEDIPQIVIAIIFLSTRASGVDGIAVTCLVVSFLSMIGNAVVAWKSLRA